MNQENKEIIDFMEMNYSETVSGIAERMMYSLVKFEFPNIKNLKIKQRDKTSHILTLSFDKGDYTEEEVKNRINKIIKRSLKFKKNY